MATYRDYPRDHDHERDERLRASWLDEDRHRERGQGRGRGRGREHDDEPSGRQAHGEAGRERGSGYAGAYPSGRHAGSGEGAYGRSAWGSPGFEERGQRGWDWGHEDPARRTQGYDSAPFGARGYGEGRGFGASQGEQRFRTGVFMGEADEQFRAGGRYPAEHGYGARTAYGGDFTSGGDFERGGDLGRGGRFRGHGPKNYMRTDQRITEDLCERLTDDDDVDARDIEVQVKEGVATLSGTVAERWMKHRAEDLAEACGGVREVDNRIRVVRDSGPGEPGSMAADAGTTPAGWPRSGG